MTALLEDRKRELIVETRRGFASKTLFGAPSKRRSLDDEIVGVRNELVANRTTKCLVCGGAMAPTHGRAHDVVTGGRCRNCGSTLFS
jgi:hypothetical protein